MGLASSKKESIRPNSERGVLRMRGDRKYERHDIGSAGDTETQIKAIIKSGNASECVCLSNYSLGGALLLCKKEFSLGEKIYVSIDLGQRGKVELKGIVARVILDGGEWHTEVDFRNFYG
jgi:hypothetical protein